MVANNLNVENRLWWSSTRVIEKERNRDEYPRSPLWVIQKRLETRQHVMIVSQKS
jgi:hypothetical protein